ncbi:hypothetical protein TUM4433_11370 [Shewanella schlegeliana]|uniref:Uncharacterized protein n=1 Tax=Shewanella schlegeliana TaxID=190308 RepID=A0ABS1SZH4_9GAMM|nr:hypothetical protein [Shewanella schlegeliana]MBL4913824.1 hypothetical protein [Shewanella schlegeliana]GIU26003.1 hypothetical protein TUM4433_11370 [Shewanella schlegeliana]
MKRGWYRLSPTSALLTIGVTVLLLLNANAMYQDYLYTKEIRTSTPSGSSLAERYLILGGWPASKEHDFVSSDIDYPIRVNSNNASQKERE